MLPHGSVTLLSYLYDDGSHQAALPVRVVEDSPRWLALWLSEGTEIMYWATHDGRDPRSIPLPNRFAQRLSTAARTWRGSPVLRLVPANAPLQVLQFWDADGAFSHWYVNFEAPMTRHGARLDTVDWHVDLLIAADGTGSWKDLDEADAAVAAGHLPEERLAQARAHGSSILADVPAFLDSIGDWRAYRPPDDWGPLTLPSDWAE